jgi:hypothetical protein
MRKLSFCLPYRANVFQRTAHTRRYRPWRRSLLPLSGFLVLLVSVPAASQEVHANNKAVLWANAINLGTSFLNAGAEHYGARQCLNEGDTRFAELHNRFQKTVAISVPIDVAIGFASWKLRRKHPGLALWLPSTSAGIQTGFAIIQYTQGCF